VDEEVNRDKNGEADGMNLEVDSKDLTGHALVESVMGRYFTPETALSDRRQK